MLKFVEICGNLSKIIKISVCFPASLILGRLIATGAVPEDILAEHSAGLQTLAEKLKAVPQLAEVADIIQKHIPEAVADTSSKAVADTCPKAVADTSSKAVADASSKAVVDCPTG